MSDNSFESYASMIEEELLAAIPKDGPQSHLYELVADYPARGGKRIRPILCLTACAATGAGARNALDAAVALELLHNAFLVHDDIVDESLQRRGLPTLHARHGMPLALNAGDGLFALALERVAAAAARHPKLARAILSEFAHLLRRTIEGQAIELGWSAEGRWDISDQEYLAMVRDKTSWYSFIHPLRLGTLIGCGAIQDDAFVELGFLLGAIFQIRDDLDNLLCDPRSYDKDLGCDLVEGKRTLPVLHLLRNGMHPDVESVRGQLGRGCGATARQRLAAVLPILERSGSIAHTQSVIDVLCAKAVRKLEAEFRAQPPTRGRASLIELVEALLFPPQRVGSVGLEVGLGG